MMAWHRVLLAGSVTFLLLASLGLPLFDAQIVPAAASLPSAPSGASPESRIRMPSAAVPPSSPAAVKDSVDADAGAISPAGVGSPLASSIVAAPSLSAASPLILSGWTGLTMADDARLIGTEYVPPDVILAAGPDHIVEMVNLVMGIWTKDGTLVHDQSLSSLFGSGSDFISDPKVQYDAASGRWFASVTDVTTSAVLLTVSTSSDPTGSWRTFSFSGAGLLDQPILGVGTSTVILSVNVFSSIRGGYLGAQYWVINKTDLVNGAAVPAFYLSPLSVNDYSLHPVQVHGTSSAHYLVATYWPGSQTYSTVLQLITVRGTPPGLVTVTEKQLPMTRADVPPSADQRGSNANLDSGDIRVSDAVYQDGRIWLGFGESCKPAGDPTDRACVRLMELDTAAESVVQSFDLAVPEKHVFYPALRVDRDGNLGVVVGYSSGAEYPGVMATGRVYGDPPNAFQPARVVAAGTGPEDPSRICSSLCRYGDYFGASLDPSDLTTIWLAGEVGTASGWSTHVFAVRIKAMLTFAYSVQGGGTGYGSPSLTYVLNGTTTIAQIGSTPTTYLADPGSLWVVSATLPGSTPSEQWFARGANDTPPLPGTANASVAEDLVYFHQYNVTFSNTVLGGGTPGPRRVAIISFGFQEWIFANQVAWVDAGSPYAFENPASGSTATERWFAAQGVAGTVAGPDAISAQYYHQYLVTFGYTILGGTGYETPSVTATQLGANGTVADATASWVDAGGSYAYPPTLSGASASTRWAAGTNAMGSISSAGTITVEYRLQYLVTVTANPPGAAALVTGAGWYDIGATATLFAGTNTSYEFQGWTGSGDGSFTGSGPTASVTVNGPITEIATFLPGLTIVAGGGGSVSYSYPGGSGTVPSGTSRTLYIPPGTTVTLVAAPDSWANTFDGWSGAPSGSATTSVTLDGPATVSAVFAASSVLVLLLGLVTTAAVLAAVFWVWRRRRRGHG